MGNIALKDMSIFELRELHSKVFRLWVSNERKIIELIGQRIDSYKESVNRDYAVRLLVEKSAELHRKLVNIDNELQLRIWEGRID